MAFSEPSPLVIEGVVDEGEPILVRAQTAQHPVPRPICGAPPDRLHGYHLRHQEDGNTDAADAPPVAQVALFQQDLRAVEPEQ